MLNPDAAEGIPFMDHDAARQHAAKLLLEGWRIFDTLPISETRKFIRFYRPLRPGWNEMASIETETRDGAHEQIRAISDICDAQP